MNTNYLHFKNKYIKIIETKLSANVAPTVVCISVVPLFIIELSLRGGGGALHNFINNLFHSAEISQRGVYVAS